MIKQPMMTDRKTNSICSTVIIAGNSHGVVVTHDGTGGASAVEIWLNTPNGPIFGQILSIYSVQPLIAMK